MNNHQTDMPKWMVQGSWYWIVWMLVVSVTATLTNWIHLHFCFKIELPTTIRFASSTTQALPRYTATTKYLRLYDSTLTCSTLHLQEIDTIRLSWYRESCYLITQCFDVLGLNPFMHVNMMQVLCRPLLCACLFGHCVCTISLQDDPIPCMLYNMTWIFNVG